MKAQQALQWTFTVKVRKKHREKKKQKKIVKYKNTYAGNQMKKSEGKMKVSRNNT